MLLAIQHRPQHSTGPCRVARDREAWASRVTEARARALELSATRDSREQKIIEDQLARDRATKHLQRVELFQNRKFDILEGDKIDNGDVTVLFAEHLEVSQAGEACDKLLEHLLSIRRRMRESLTLELLRREQLATFETQYLKLESELREAERVQRAYAGRSMGGLFGAITLQESKDIHVAVAKQQVRLSSYLSVLKERREVWGMVVRRAQNLKRAMCSQEGQIKTTICHIRRNIATLRKRAGRLRAKNDDMKALRGSLKSTIVMMTTRSERLEHELLLVQAHEGQFFDTDVWQEGVMQRIATGKFVEFLKV